jgi:hypothetical protein
MPMTLGWVRSIANLEVCQMGWVMKYNGFGVSVQQLQIITGPKPRIDDG